MTALFCFIVINEIANAQDLGCPDMYTRKTVTIGTKSYSFCYRCFCTTAPTLYVSDVNAVFEGHPTKEEQKQLKELALQELIGDCSIPPCDEHNPIHLVTEAALCWSWQQELHTTPTLFYTTNLKPCEGSAICRVEVAVCVLDLGNGDYQIHELTPGEYGHYRVALTTGGFTCPGQQTVEYSSLQSYIDQYGEYNYWPGYVPSCFPASWVECNN